jgi:hypothetical protein
VFRTPVPGAPTDVHGHALSWECHVDCPPRSGQDGDMHAEAKPAPVHGASKFELRGSRSCEAS